MTMTNREHIEKLGLTLVKLENDWDPDKDEYKPKAIGGALVIPERKEHGMVLHKGDYLVFNGYDYCGFFYADDIDKLITTVIRKDDENND
ncbi:hypothetical protein M3M35_07160 [Fructilactobacillus myrtifloralis]|uniref:Co-chaperonin GroES n=1 Tax=Fructilactobacillus myrtifloralis TaxID=2940301 RepID=A0ABY5BPB5_9LACO|nr:hypothetical protein [Fructilactobacillus myrtifloralis]USS85060.1 hypothetical protein M3M35_07160 [Fructilactobacillus myrtifloralis]